MPDRRTRTLPSRSLIASGNTPTREDSGVSFTTIYFNCGSISRGIAIADEQWRFYFVYTRSYIQLNDSNYTHYSRGPGMIIKTARRAKKSRDSFVIVTNFQCYLCDISTRIGLTRPAWLLQLATDVKVFKHLKTIGETTEFSCFTNLHICGKQIRRQSQRSSY